jgi:hypothetical protein
VTRDEMMKRVARFKELRGSDGGLPDSDVPESRKTLYAVIGFQPPQEKLNEATFSPVGVARRFMNVTYNQPDQEHILMAIIGGNQPQSEFTPDAMKRCNEWKQQKAAPRV